MVQRYGDIRKALTCKPTQNAETKTVWKENAREYVLKAYDKPEEVHLHYLFGLLNSVYRLDVLRTQLMLIQPKLNYPIE